MADRERIAAIQRIGGPVTEEVALKLLVVARGEGKAYPACIEWELRDGRFLSLWTSSSERKWTLHELPASNEKAIVVAIEVVGHGPESAGILNRQLHAVRDRGHSQQ